ncbi:SDR family NAD(P)-dependent oxidoreductase [Luteolibacter algae]|uniref:SDR family NAD(P)-dependent oxidoreductase n=1 Tax=Luteolibacter algae TaxID=454151 RepID=A0ABW5D625_9BACT
MERYYSCALITGASSGLGEEFVKQLAGRVDKMVLVSRRVGRLDQIAGALRESHPGMAVLVHAADLAKAEERRELAQKLGEVGFTPDLLINNAGLGDYGEFLTADWNTVEAMLKVNVEALTHLSHLFAPEMARRGAGAILNVSSLASTLPIPDFAVYAATKAYVSSFTEALRIELQEEGVIVMSLCPGPVKTGFGETARREGNSEGMPSHALFYVPKEQVVAEGLRGLDQGRARVFPGLKIAVAGLLISAIPLVVLRMVMGCRPRRS